MTTLNIPNLTKLAEWLEAGAPHAYFSMKIGVCPPTDKDVAWSSGRRYTFEKLFKDSPELNKPDCGTVCCIAGAAHLMSEAEEGQLFPSLEEQLTFRPSWDNTAEAALDYLGLTRRPLSEIDYHRAHDLFDMDLAPANCTPAQAAVAVRRVMAGEEPWGARR